MKVTEQQKQFFETFGYLGFPGLFQNELQEIIAEFRGVFDDKGIEHGAKKRSMILPFVDEREQFCKLLDHPKIRAIGTALLGADFNYLGSDGNYYVGDTGWHNDGFHEDGCYIKLAFYLDPVTKNTGALRVIPGSHQVENKEWRALRSIESKELWGIDQSDVPSIALESNPGDLVLFNHNIMHGAFGGSTERRMFTLNLCRKAKTPEEIEDLENYIGALGRFFWVERVYGSAMLETADALRMTHLQQVLDHQGHLPAIAAHARSTMAEQIL